MLSRCPSVWWVYLQSKHSISDGSGFTRQSKVKKYICRSTNFKYSHSPRAKLRARGGLASICPIWEGGGWKFVKIRIFHEHSLGTVWPCTSPLFAKFIWNKQNKMALFSLVPSWTYNCNRKKYQDGDCCYQTILKVQTLRETERERKEHRGRKSLRAREINTVSDMNTLVDS